MANTLGYHLVKSGYGLWLPGDDRGSWSAAWDDQIGYYEPNQLHEGDPMRHRMAKERMKHPPVRLDRSMIDAVVSTMRQCTNASDWQLAAFSVEPTHLHLLITYFGRDIDRTAKWLAQEMTKAVHRRTHHTGPVWCEGWWRGFIYDRATWDNTRRYIERHNERRHGFANPHDFVSPM